MWRPSGRSRACRAVAQRTEVTRYGSKRPRREQHRGGSPLLAEGKLGRGSPRGVVGGRLRPWQRGCLTDSGQGRHVPTCGHTSRWTSRPSSGRILIRQDESTFRTEGSNIDFTHGGDHPRLSTMAVALHPRGRARRKSVGSAQVFPGAIPGAPPVGDAP